MTVTRKYGIWKWIRSILVGLLILITIFGGLTWKAGTAAKTKLKEEYPAPGQLVDVGGYRLHIHCMGQGSPTVILEAGNNDFSVQWSEVQPEISGYTRVCAYDRAGFGWSETSPHPRTVGTMVNELHTLLTNAGIEGPYILVGHSFGGIIVRAYFQQYPHDVQGMLLVDSAHEQQAQRIPGFIKAVRQVTDQFRTLSVMNSFGFLALSPQQIPGRGLSGQALEQYRAILATTDYFNAASIETDSIFTQMGDTQNNNIASLGDLPLIVLSRGLPEPLPGLSDAENQQYEQIWQVMQKELAGLSTNSRQIIAKNSGHYIQIQKPDLVINAISELIGGKFDTKP